MTRYFVGGLLLGLLGVIWTLVTPGPQFPIEIVSGFLVGYCGGSLHLRGWK